MPFFKVLSVSALVLLLTSCATILNSGSQTIQALPTTGDNVKVKITTPSGAYTTKLPTTIVAEPSSFYDVTIGVIDNCYEATITTAKKSITPAYIVNILFWPGLIVDALTGSMWKYNNTVSVTTVPKSGECKI